MLLKLAWGNVRKSARDFAIYFVTVVLGVAIFYAFNSITDQQAVGSIGNASAMRELLNMIIRYVSVFIAVVLAFLVIYANRFLIRRRSKEFGLYLVMGMRTGQVLAIVGLETLLTGLLSLVVGFACGIGFSQLIMMGTASLFGEQLEGFAMGVSWNALGLTAGLFAAIFLAAALLNSRRIAGSPLLELLHADRRNERLVLRNLPLSVVLFIASVACIGYSYHLLMENGLLEPGPEFLAATVLVCIGTGLFFYSLSGFLLKAVQLVRPLYLRGLNMFTLRQLNAKLNTTVASMTIVCIALFLSITSVCGGVGIVNAMNGSIEQTTAYDASVSTTFATFYDTDTESVSQDDYDAAMKAATGRFGAFARACGYDMLEGLRKSAAAVGQPDPTLMIQESVQVNRVMGLGRPLVFGDLEQLVPRSLKDCLGAYANGSGTATLPIGLVSLSEANAARQLAGLEPLQVAQGQGLILYDSAFMTEFWRQFEGGGQTLQVGGRPCTLAGVMQATLETTPIPMDTGTLVVPDDALPAERVILSTVLDVQLRPDASQEAFAAIADAIHESSDPDTWPINIVSTRDSVREQTSGMTGLVAFLAIYIGFILTIACAAILAIQQLSEASDNARRYRLLRKLGCSESMIAGSLLAQVCIYFLAPLLLALAHSACALSVVGMVIAVFGNLDIGRTALMAAGAFLATYGIYLILTYLMARKLTR